MYYVEHTFPRCCPSFLLFIMCQSCKPPSIHKLETNLKAYHIHDTTQRKTLLHTTLTTLFDTKKSQSTHKIYNTKSTLTFPTQQQSQTPTSCPQKKKENQNKTNKQSEAKQNPTQGTTQQTPTTTTLPRFFLCYMQTH